MKKYFAGISAIAVLLLLAGCNVESESSSSDSDSSETSDVNVASSDNGASVSTTYQSSSAGNLIDGDTTTYLESDPGTSIVVAFGQEEND